MCFFLNRDLAEAISESLPQACIQARVFQLGEYEDADYIFFLSFSLSIAVLFKAIINHYLSTNTGLEYEDKLCRGGNVSFFCFKCPTLDEFQKVDGFIPYHFRAKTFLRCIFLVALNLVNKIGSATFRRNR